MIKVFQVIADLNRGENLTKEQIKEWIQGQFFDSEIIVIELEAKE